MSTHIVNLDEARKKRPSTVMSDEEKREIVDYLKAHPYDKKAIPHLMKKHNCSNTTIGILIMQDERNKQE